MCTPDRLDCVKGIDFEYEECHDQCSGLWVTSFAQDNLFSKEFSFKRKVSKLSAKYWIYKGFYEFPSQYKGSYWLLQCKQKYNFVEYDLRAPLRYIRINFDSPVFDRIIKDRSAKFVDILSAIGGTMGLLTGFSIISGVEIGYFALKIVFRYCFKKIINI